MKTYVLPNGRPRRYYNDTGALDTSNFAPVFAGWNVWDIWQTKDLDFSIMMVGVSADRQLRIFVEDALRLSSVDVADSLDLKGGQIEILNGPPTGLVSAKRKESLPLTIPAVNGPANLKTVRFYNHGSAQPVAWPHDDNYLLEEVYQPAPDNPATSGPAPATIAGTVAGGLLQPLKTTGAALLASPVVWVAGGGLLLYLYINSKAPKYVKRIRNP